MSQSATSLSARSLPSASKATNTETGLAKYVANTHCLPHVVCPRPANSHTQCLGIHTNSRTWLSVDKPTEGRRCCDLDPEICQRSVHIHDADHRGDNLSLSSLLHLTKTTIKKYTRDRKIKFQHFLTPFNKWPSDLLSSMLTYVVNNKSIFFTTNTVGRSLSFDLTQLHRFISAAAVHRSTVQLKFWRHLL